MDMTGSAGQIVTREPLSAQENRRKEPKEGDPHHNRCVRGRSCPAEEENRAGGIGEDGDFEPTQLVTCEIEDYIIWIPDLNCANELLNQN